MLIVLFTLPGDLLASATRQELQQRLVATYFRTRGTVTSALRTAINDLNNSLLRRNLRTREGNMQGLLTVAVLRRDMLTLGHVGTTQSFLLRPGGVQRLNEGEPGGVGLGVSRTYRLRFSQARIQPGDQLLLVTIPPTGWTLAALAEIAQQPPEQARVRLKELAGKDVEAALAVVQQGAGVMSEVKPQAAAPIRRRERRAGPIQGQALQPGGSAPETEPEQAGFAAPPTGLETEMPAGYIEIEPVEPPVQRTEGLYLSGAPSGAEPETPLAVPPRPIPQEPLRRLDRSARTRTVREQPAGEPKPARLPSLRLPHFNLRSRLASIWRTGRRTGRQVNQGGKAFAGRLMPGRSEQQQLSPGLLLFVAVAVPIIVVAVAATIYIYAPSGRTEQQQASLNQAAQYAAQAGQDQNEVLKRNSWGQVLYWLDESDRYGKTDESDALRKQANNALDAMDGITRVELQPVFTGGFDTSLQFTRMVATPTDVYLLELGPGPDHAPQPDRRRLPGRQRVPMRPRLDQRGAGRGPKDRSGAGGRSARPGSAAAQ